MLQFLLTRGRFDIDAIGSGLHISFGALQRLIQSFRLSGICSCNNENILARTGRDRSLDLLLHYIARYDSLPAHVPTALRRDLILDKDCRHSHGFV